MQTNHISHYLSESGIRLTACDTSAAAKKAAEAQGLPSVSAMLLAKVMTGAALLTNDFKNKEGVTFKWVTGSPLGEIHADAYDGHFVRGYVESPEAGAGKTLTTAEEAALVSAAGRLFVTRYSLLKLPYTSAVPLPHGDVSACLTAYLNTSEQTLSAVKISVTTDAAGNITHSAGFLAQLMPKGNLARFAALFRDLSRWDLAAETGESSLTALLVSEHFEPLSDGPLDFRCTCSEARIHDALVTLPQAEKEELLKDESIESVCHYCGKKYTIPREKLEAWFKK